MRSFRILLPALGILLIYAGCRKNEAPSQQSNGNKVTSLNFYSPENVTAGSIESDTLITNFKQLAALIKQQQMQTVAPAYLLPPPAVFPNTYLGYTSSYDCNSNTWTYTFQWDIKTQGTSATDTIGPGIGSLTIGSFSQTAPLQVTSSILATLPLGRYAKEFVLSYVISGVPDDANYCNTDSMQNAISFTYQAEAAIPPGSPVVTVNYAASYSEPISPNSYVIYPYLVPSYTALGNDSFNIYVVPGVLTCGPCHESALGFSPTMYFYYHLVGSSSAWSSVASNGNDLNGFNVTVTQAGTYEYYTQGYITPGVLSGELYYGTISVQ